MTTVTCACIRPATKSIRYTEPMLIQCLRRWPNIEATFGRCIVLTGKKRSHNNPSNTKHVYNIYTTSSQHLRCWSKHYINVIQKFAVLMLTITLKALKCLCNNHGDQRVFQSEIIILNVLVSRFRFI